MGHRLSKIVTRTGDAGTTGLGDGTRVAKDSARIEAIGAVDELNSALGVLLAEPLPDAVCGRASPRFSTISSISAASCRFRDTRRCSEAQVLRLEDGVERFNADLAPLKEFILPGGTRAASLAHVARTVCRRAERSVVRLGAIGTGARVRRASISTGFLTFSSCVARVLNRAGGAPDVLWRKDRRTQLVPWRSTPASSSSATPD